MTIVSADALLLGGSVSGPGAVVVEDGLVTDVLDRVPADVRDHVRLGDAVLTAGLVDLQVNGFAGADLATASPAEWSRARSAIARSGVTSFVPTLVSSPVEEIGAWIRLVEATAATTRARGEAAIVGVHVEGPFLSPAHAGAHDSAMLCEPDHDTVSALLAELPRSLASVVTLAPELPGGIEAVRRLASAGCVVSLGHSDADSATTRAAADAGARLVTHLFNAQRAFHQREPGLGVTALVDPRLRVGVIADGHHLADDAVRLAFAAARDRVVLVTDAVAAAQMPPGSYALAGAATRVAAAGGPPRLADGTLAGSTLTLDRAVRVVVSLGIEPATALVAATRAPADVLGRSDLGRIDVGTRADLVAWDSGLCVRDVWIDGLRIGPS